MTTGTHRVAFYADIFYNSELSPSYWIPPGDLDVEAILLGGDIHYSPDQLGSMLEEIRATQRSGTQIVMVPGNGEYIDQELNQSRQEYKAAVERVPDAVFLDDDVVTLGSGLRVIGSTLWSHVDEDQIDAYSRRLADHGLRGVDSIRLDGRFLTLKDTNELYDRARSFIEEQLRPLPRTERQRTPGVHTLLADAAAKTSTDRVLTTHTGSLPRPSTLVDLDDQAAVKRAVEAHLIDLVLDARPAAISFEGANPRHEHEWKVFEDVKLPDGKVIIPGVLDSTTNFIEHPELVAQRLVGYAEVVGKTNVIAGSDCGFATIADFPTVDPRITWAKLAAMAEGANLASQYLWGQTG